MDENNKKTREKERLLKPIRAGMEEIDRKLKESYTAAEKAVDNLLTYQLLDDYLRDKENTEKLLQQFLKQIVSISDSISLSVSPLRKQEAAKGPNNFVGGTLRVPVLNVTFEKAYKVQMLSPGTPDHFWLRLVDITIQVVENWMNTFYSSQTCLVSYPDLGSYVICLSDSKFYRAMVTKINYISTDAPIFEVLLVDYGEVRVTSVNSLFAMDERFCQPATALLCTLGKMQPSTPAFLNSSKFFFGSSENLTAVFHALSEEDRSTESNIIYPIFHVTLQKTEVTSGCSRIVDVRSLLQRGLSGLVPPEKPSGREFHSNQSCITQLSDPKKPVAPSVATNRVPNLSYYADPQYDSKWDKPCYSKASRQPQSPLTAQGRQNLLHSSISGSSRFFGTSSKGSHLDPNAFEFHPAPLVPQLCSSPNHLPTNAQISISHQGVTVGPQSSHLRSPNSVLVAATQPSYRAISQIPTQPRFVPNQSPVMATPAPAYQPSSPQITLRPPGITNSGDIESLLRSSQNLPARSLNAIVPPGSAQNSVNTVAPTAMKSAVKVPDSQAPPVANQLPVSVQSEGCSLSPPPVFPGLVRSDPVLLEKFLNTCLLNPHNSLEPEFDLSDSVSFVTASAHDSDQLTIDNNPIDGAENTESMVLQYDPELTLKKRPVPEFGSIFTFKFTCIHSPSLFFIRIDDDFGMDWENLNENLKKLYGRAVQFSHETEPEMGSFWVAQDADGRWTRVEVMALNSHNQSVSVLHVDYGHVTTVSFSSLRPLVADVAAIPILAVYSKLVGIYPVNGDEHSESWSDDTVTKFIHLTRREEKHKGSSAGVDGDALEVLIYDKGDEDGLTVNELLVKQGLASSSVFQMKEISEFDGWDPMGEDFYSPRNTLSLDTEHYDSVTAGYIPQDEARICRFFRASGFCYKGVKCSQLHAVPDGRAFTSDTAEVYGWLAPLQQTSPVIGTYVTAKVSSVIAPNHFYAILCLQEKSRSGEGDTYETLDSLQEDLQEEYNSKYLVHRYPTEVHMGDVVIAQNPSDSKWYRGRVLENVGQYGRCSVLFFDFGFVESVNMKKICKPLPRFLYLPIQAFECFLHGVKAPEASKADEGRQVFFKMVANKKLIAFIVEREPFLLVDLFDRSPGCENDVDIAKELISKGLVQAAEKKPLGRRLKAAVIAAG